jgi:hypothetical protein
MKDNFVTIKSFSSIFEAEILNGKLNAYGIESFIQKDDCGGTDPVMHLTLGVHIKVKKNDYEEALALINENGSRKNENRNITSKSMIPFWILMFLSVGTGLFLSGHEYYPGLIKYGVISVIIGGILWFVHRIKRKKENTT